MKILKHGDQVKILICKECGAELEVVPEDIIDEEFECVDYINPIKYRYNIKITYIKCPECGKKHICHVYNDGTDITEFIKEN